MKTRRHIFGGLMLAAAALVCLTGCKKDDEGEKITLGVDFEQTAGTQKTYIGNEDKTIYWSTNDQVQVNGTNYLVHDGVVEVNMCDDGYAAVYPATNTLTYSSETHSGKTCIGGEVVIPATQTYAADANGIQQLNGPMAARLDSKTGRLLFRNLYAVIKVTVKAKETETFTLSSITVHSTENLAGTLPFTFSGTTNGTEANVVLSTTSLSNVSKSVTLTFAKDTTIPANGSADFYLYMLPYTPKDLTILLNGNQKDSKDRTEFTDKVERSRLGYTTVNVSTLTVLFSGIGRFKVGNNKYVTFAPGNLQYQASSKSWRFAEHQWDIIGDNAGNTTAEASRATQANWIDLFGWGTSGWNNGNTFYQPYDCSNATTEPYTPSKGYGYGPTDGTSYTFDLTGTYENSDWGVYKAIYNPQTGLTDPKGTWRTLTNDEWSYLLNTREGWKYDRVITNDVKEGLLIYPDGITAKPSCVTETELTGNSNDKVTITQTELEALEAMGCVFLPTAGWRNKAEVLFAGFVGFYWSSTCSSNNAYCLGFGDALVPSIASNTMNPSLSISRFFGMSVRLVKEVE